MLQVILTKIALILLAVIVVGLIVSFSKDNKSYKVDDLYEDAHTGRIYRLKGRKRIYYN